MSYPLDIWSFLLLIRRSFACSRREFYDSLAYELTGLCQFRTFVTFQVSFHRFFIKQCFDVCIHVRLLYLSCFVYVRALVSFTIIPGAVLGSQHPMLTALNSRAVRLLRNLSIVFLWSDYCSDRSIPLIDSSLLWSLSPHLEKRIDPLMYEFFLWTLARGWTLAHWCCVYYQCWRFFHNLL